MARPLPQTLFLDACVLYPAPIRDLFMGLALEGLVRLKWNRRVQEEWIHNLLKDRHDLTPEQQAKFKVLQQEKARKHRERDGRPGGPPSSPDKAGPGSTNR